MIDVSFEVHGLEQVQASLTSLPAAVTKRLRGFMGDAATTLRGMVQQNIAASFHSTGALYQGVKSEIIEDGSGVSARIAIEGVPYAHIQEEGGTVQIPEIAPVNARVLAFSIPARGAVSAIAARGNGSTGAVFSMRAKAHPVTIPEHPYARQALADYRQPFQTGIRETVRAALGEL